ncbi:MAG: 6-bladed beta-propeller, partial [Tannerella sp.]|nr:6-bladed beta-propeller [Tannerella sp.]
MSIGFFLCTGKEQPQEKAAEEANNPPYYIKIDRPDVSSLKPLRLSEIADSITYVQLETIDDCLRGPM